MKLYIPGFLLSLALMAHAMPVGAEDIEPFYRVEVLVFLHADSRPDARHSESFEDYTGLLDPLHRAAEVEAGDNPDTEPGVGSAEDDPRATLELLETLNRLEDGSLTPEIPTWPEPFIALEQLSDPMARARQQIEGNFRYQLLTSRAWHQPLSRGLSATRVRIHDRNVIEADWIRMTPTGIPALETLGDGPIESLMPALHYRLDGGVQLRQRQFMHMEVDLQWRVPAIPAPVFPFMEPPSGDGYEIHRLQQHRTVRAGRLEYFDSRWLGVLVLITELEPLDGIDTDPDEDSEAPEDADPPEGSLDEGA